METDDDMNELGEGLTPGSGLKYIEMQASSDIENQYNKHMVYG